MDKGLLRKDGTVLHAGLSAQCMQKGLDLGRSTAC